MPRKGEDLCAIQASANDLELSGYTDFVFKSDGEASIKALRRRAVEELRKKFHAISRRSCKIRTKSGHNDYDMSL